MIYPWAFVFWWVRGSSLARCLHLLNLDSLSKGICFGKCVDLSYAYMSYERDNRDFVVELAIVDLC